MLNGGWVSQRAASEVHDEQTNKANEVSKEYEAMGIEINRYAG
jgi:hypothetical protein